MKWITVLITTWEEIGSSWPLWLVSIVLNSPAYGANVAKESAMICQSVSQFWIPHLGLGLWRTTNSVNKERRHIMSHTLPCSPQFPSQSWQMWTNSSYLGWTLHSKQEILKAPWGYYGNWHWRIWSERKTWVENLRASITTISLHPTFMLWHVT